MRRRGWSAGVFRGSAALRATAGRAAPIDSGSEHEHQATLIERVRLEVATGALPQQLRRLFAVPSGSLRHPVVAQKLQAEGVVPGVPDLLCPFASTYGKDTWGQTYVGLALEMKRPKDSNVGVHGLGWGVEAATEAQRDWLEALARAGWYAAVAFGVDAGYAALLRYVHGSRTGSDGFEVKVYGGVDYWRRPLVARGGRKSAAPRKADRNEEGTHAT